MITDIDSIFQLKQSWPPADEDTQKRLQLYEKNAKLFKGKHNAIWIDEIRKLRADKSGALRDCFERTAKVNSSITQSRSLSLTREEAGTIQILFSAASRSAPCGSAQYALPVTVSGCVKEEEICLRR